MSPYEEHPATIQTLLSANKKLADCANRHSQLYEKLIETCNQMAVENRKQRESIKTLKKDIANLENMGSSSNVI